MDEDVNLMTVDQLRDEVRRLRVGIRQHRDASNHDLCWYVPELWNLLPDKVDPQLQIPPTEEFIACCKLYRKSLEDK